jgi:pre-mRNA-splicing factor ATP-dependent RNA helicase DHX15/PRP43
MYHREQVIVLSSDTGTGKTTQIPQFILFDEWNNGGQKIVCTQPRKLAAASAAKRVAQELDVKLGGNEVSNF